MSDPLSAAIEAAVARAIEAQLPVIVEAVKAGLPAKAEEPDRFIKHAIAAEMLGHSPSSLKRLIRNGTLPPAEKVGGKNGYRASTIKAILGGIDGPVKKRGRA